MNSTATHITHNHAPHSHFLNRELGLIAFNRRVLAQAQDERVPLLERLFFLCIVSSNLDEFFEIRMAGLKEQIKGHSQTRTTDGRLPQEAYNEVSAAVHRLVADQYRELNDTLLPAAANEGIRFLRRSQWTDAQREWIRDYFFREVMPVLTPIGLDPSHPFPRIYNKSLNFIVELEGRDAFGRSSGIAIVQAPRVLPRIIRLPQALTPESDYTFIFLSSIVHAFVGELFSGMTVQGCYQFRVTRNSDLFVDEEEVKNLRAKIQGELPQRNFGDAVRLEVADNTSPAMTEFLLTQFGLEEKDLYRVEGPVNLVRLMQVPSWVDRPDLKFPTFVPGDVKRLEKGKNIFNVIRKGDVLLYHPYQRFTPVIQLLESAATDPQVVAIKMTVYRTGTDSVLMNSLIRAAQNGKEVTVVVELLARFDEETNVSWATKLEEVGAHVVYGVVGYKTHAKALLILRREEDDSGTPMLRHYVHLGTGNYHPRTARLYTDFGLLTCNEAIGMDVSEVFKQLTGLGRAQTLHYLWQAPFTLSANMMKAIEAEKLAAEAGRKGRIVVKMNSLLEPAIIEALYAASQAGVEIDLIVRGVCALRPGVPGLSDNIKVRSVIGRFLEHTRVFYFYADGEEKVYLSSADWMERNFFRRIELAFPILDPRLKKRVITEGLKLYLADNQESWDMDSDGVYTRRKPGRNKPHCAQQDMANLLGKIL